MKNQNRMNSQHKKIFMLRKKAIEKNVDHVNLRKTCIFVSTIILSILALHSVIACKILFIEHVGYF